MVTKTLLVAVNAKYIHSNPAVRCLKEYAYAHHTKEIGQIEIAEFTINQPVEQIISKIAKARPDIVGLSCYIWNYEYMIKICGSLRRILPKAVLFLGGPQVSYHCEKALAECRANYCISGEGEILVMRLIEDICAGNPPKEPVLGRGYANDAADLSDIPFIYSDMTEYQNRIVYYESSRGCPFRCAYCLSSIKGTDAPVRYLPMERVYSDLDFFLKNNLRQVKFIDRTFNCDPERALKMLRYIIAHDNGVTNFHFEAAAELLTDPLIETLQSARFGLFQLEIGVQSTNPLTLAAIHRFTNPKKLQNVIGRLQKNQNVHLHLDLIAGLPHEGIKEFAESFRFVYSLKPQQFQLGFLKVLAGSEMETLCEKYGIVYADYPPYEVLYTDALPYADLQRLKALENVLELYYNSGRFSRCMDFLEKLFTKKEMSSFELYDRLGKFYQSRGYDEASQNPVKQFDILREFLLDIAPKDADAAAQFADCARFDLCAHGKPKKAPDWMETALDRAHHLKALAILSDPAFRKRHFADTVYEGMDSKQLIRIFEIQFFARDLSTGQNCPEYVCFFDYTKPTLSGGGTAFFLPAGD